MNTEEFRELIVGVAAHQSESLLTNSLLQAIAEHTAANSFTSGKSDTAELQDAGLGIAIAHWTRWDGERILRVASAALQDANFHSEDAQVRQMLEDLHRE